MLGIDSGNPLAYLDYSQLRLVIADEWPLFEHSLPARASWDGRQEDLLRIRHRVGHARRPHDDDLSRIEQTLRDLERGAFIAAFAYGDRHVPDAEESEDPVVRGWILGHHDTAQRLVEHAQRQYETNIRVSASRRPWVRASNGNPGNPGVLWHVEFFMRGRSLNLRQLWRDSYLDLIKPHLLFLESEAPSHVAFSFASIDDSNSIADAIGYAFDAVLSVGRNRDISEDEWYHWKRRSENLDYRIQVQSVWTLVSEQTLPISLFGAGGGTAEVPRWARG
jgi:hypothetical protein